MVNLNRWFIFSGIYVTWHNDAHISKYQENISPGGNVLDMVLSAFPQSTTAVLRHLILNILEL